MKLINELTEAEIMMLRKIDIEITDKKYMSQEIIDICDKCILNGEIAAVENNKNGMAKQYGDLADKLIRLEDK